MANPSKTRETCLVSGGAGFIGSHLCHSLVKKGYRVLCVDNFITGSKENVLPLMEENNFLLINADVIRKLPEAVLDEKIDYIFHLASPASPNKNSPISFINLPLETMDVNCLGTRRLLRLARKKGARFLFASTSEIYGDPKVHPQKEDYWGYVNPHGIRSCYDESKRFGEALSFVYLKRFNVNVRVVRIFNTYGPNMDLRDGRAIVNFIIQALKNEPMTIYGRGNQTRSFCYVADLVDGLQKACFGKETKGRVYNLGNTEELSILKLAQKIKKEIKSKSVFKYEKMPSDDPRKRKPDISRAKKELGFEPKVKFNQGLKKTIEYFKKKLNNEN